MNAASVDEQVAPGIEQTMPWPVLSAPRVIKPEISSMVKTFEQAIAEVESLPDADQEQIGRQLLSHVEKLRRLREELDRGVRSLDAGLGKPVDIDEFVRQKIK
jgi:hypothetical protein